MLKLIKWLLILFLAVVVMSGLFALYTHFLVDYSMESLEAALADQTEDANVDSVAKSHIYYALSEDLALHEAISSKPDFENLSFAQKASRALDEAYIRDGKNRAKSYLRQIVNQKKEKQPLALKIRESLAALFAGLSRTGQSLLGYFKRSVLRQDAQSDSVSDGVRFVFLRKTQNLEKDGKYKEAIERYQQYLKRYPENPDWGFVSISLSYVLIKESRLREAERILQEVRSRYAGSAESKIAGFALSRVEALKKAAGKVENLRKEKLSGQRNETGAQVDYELAVLLMSLNRFLEAQELLKKISQNPGELGAEALFKLGWISRKQKEWQEAEKNFQKLLARGPLPLDLELGVYSELADIYYQQRNYSKALEYYRKIKAVSKAPELGAESTWKSMASYEEAAIYQFDLKDKTKAVEALRSIDEYFIEAEPGSNFSSDFFNVSGDDLRAQAFRALGARQLGLAYEFFNRYLVTHPNDAWTFAGISTVSLMLGDFRDAQEYARKAYAVQPDEYTSSMIGYVYGTQREYSRAEAVYQKALQINPDYLPAQFNIACMQIRQRKYEPALEMLLKMESIKSLSTILKAKIYNNLGYLHWQLGRPEDALEKFKKAVTIEPDYLIAGQNIKRIEAKGAGPVFDGNALKIEKV